MFSQNSFSLSSSHEGEEGSTEAGGGVGAAAEDEVGEAEGGARGGDVGEEQVRVGSIEEEGEGSGEEGTIRKQPLGISKSLEVRIFLVHSSSLLHPCNWPLYFSSPIKMSPPDGVIEKKKPGKQLTVSFEPQVIFVREQA